MHAEYKPDELQFELPKINRYKTRINQKHVETLDLSQYKNTPHSNMILLYMQFFGKNYVRNFNL